MGSWPAGKSLGATSTDMRSSSSGGSIGAAPTDESNIVTPAPTAAAIASRRPTCFNPVAATIARGSPCVVLGLILYWQSWIQAKMPAKLAPMDIKGKIHGSGVPRSLAPKREDGAFECGRAVRCTKEETCGGSSRLGGRVPVIMPSWTLAVSCGAETT